MIEVSYYSNKDFYKKFWIVFAIHVFLFLIGYLVDFSALFSQNFDEKTAQMLKSSVRVDVVGMPKYTFQELKELEKAYAEQGDAAEDKKEIQKPDTINDDDIALEEASKVNLKNLLGNYGKKQIKKKDVKKDKGKISVKDLKSLVLEGNKISSGSSIVGDNSAEIQTEFEKYVQGLPDLVRRFWKLPSYLKEQELNCRIRIFVDSEGRVIRKVIAESSGVEEFDQKALSAVELASPLPKPDPQILRKLVRGDVYLGFPL